MLLRGFGRHIADAHRADTSCCAQAVMLESGHGNARAGLLHTEYVSREHHQVIHQTDVLSMSLSNIFTITRPTIAARQRLDLIPNVSSLQPSPCLPPHNKQNRTFCIGETR